LLNFSSVNETPYYAGLPAIPNLPSIVIVPRTLGPQWVEQIDKFTHPGGFSVVRYSVDRGPLETFSTNPKGDYQIAAGKDGEYASRVIVVADISVGCLPWNL
jgi:hypothetical protein